MNARSFTTDLLIIGAGPAGLNCGIEAKKHGMEHLVVDKGTITDAIRRFPEQMIFFSTPELIEIGGVPFNTANFRPSRVEALQYYRRTALHFGLNLKLHTHITKLHTGENGFVAITAKDERITAKYVILALGYYDVPHKLNIPGENLSHVSHFYHEPFQHFQQKVIVVGGRSSAVEAALDLYRHDVAVTLVHRRETLGDSVKYWIRPDIENRLKQGSIIGRFNCCITEIREGEVDIINVDTNKPETLKSDFVYLLTGYQPDMSLLQQAGGNVNPDTLEPEFNPKTLETNIPGLYLAGSITGGKATGNIFIENSREHAPVIIQSLLRQ